VAIGGGAALGNTLAGMFVVGSSNLPSYANPAAAAAAITVALGATAGCYYLYHNQADGTVRVIIP
jgi:uncharacterized protein HemX